ncbi:MAG: BrnT family toxin [Methylococcaceae bacterium]
MKFEWDENKNKINIQKHGVNFEDARTVFDDPLQISKLDYRFSYFEERWITLGTAKNQRLLVVVNLFFTNEGEEIIRIISARPANPNERATYEHS